MTADFLYSKYANKFAAILDESVSGDKRWEIVVDTSRALCDDFEAMVKEKHDETSDILEVIAYVNEVINEFAKKLEAHFERPIINQNALITLIKNNLLGDVKDEISDN